MFESTLQRLGWVPPRLRKADEWSADFRKERESEPVDLPRVEARLGDLERELLVQQDALTGLAQRNRVQKFLHFPAQGVRPGRWDPLYRDLQAKKEVHRTERQLLRKALVPPALYTYLDRTNALLRESKEGVQFPGFTKYVGQEDTPTQRHIQTLFHDGQSSHLPAHFWGYYEPDSHTFVSEQMYRQSLRSPAAVQICVEQLRAVCVLEELNHFLLKNVQEPRTLAILVGESKDAPIRTELVDTTPLGKLAQAALAGVGLRVCSAIGWRDQHGLVNIDFLVK
jgi:hypothetical protein